MSIKKFYSSGKKLGLSATIVILPWYLLAKLATTSLTLCVRGLLMAVHSEVMVHKELQRITIEIKHKGSTEMLSFLLMFGVVVWALLIILVISSQQTNQLNMLLFVAISLKITLWVMFGLWYFCGIERLLLCNKKLIHHYQLFCFNWRKGYCFNDIRQVRLTTERDFERAVGGAPWAKMFKMKIALIHGLDWSLLGQNLTDKDAEALVSLIRGALEQE